MQSQCFRCPKAMLLAPLPFAPAAGCQPVVPSFPIPYFLCAATYLSVLWSLKSWIRGVLLSAFLRMLLNHGKTFFRQYSFASSILKLAAAAAASSALATGSLMSTAAMLLLSFSFSFSFSFSISFSFSFSMKGMTSLFVTDANFSISMLICMRMKRNASRMSKSTSCSSFLIGKTKEK